MQLWLDWVHLETLIQSTAVYFRAHTLNSTIHYLSRFHRRVSEQRHVFLEHFFLPIDTRLFWAIDKLCEYQTRINFFDCQMFMQYWMYAGPSNAYDCLNLTVGHMTFLQYQLAHNINGFRINNWFWTTFTKFVLEWTKTSVKFTIPSINIGVDGASSPKIELSSSMHSCWVNPRRKL